MTREPLWPGRRTWARPASVHESVPCILERPVCASISSLDVRGLLMYWRAPDRGADTGIRGVRKRKGGVGDKTRMAVPAGRSKAEHDMPLPGRWLVSP